MAKTYRHFLLRDDDCAIFSSHTNRRDVCCSDGFEGIFCGNSKLLVVVYRHVPGSENAHRLGRDDLDQRRW
jgi:hypothetical protein